MNNQITPSTKTTNNIETTVKAFPQSYNKDVLNSNNGPFYALTASLLLGFLLHKGCEIKLKTANGTDLSVQHSHQ